MSRIFQRDKNVKRTKELLELVYCDLVGPMEVDFLGGNEYYFIFVDEKSQKVFRYLLQTVFLPNRSSLMVSDNWPNYPV